MARASSRTSGSRTKSSGGISRIDQDSTRTHGFFVRLGYSRGSDGTWRPRHRAFFGDASHGGKKGALRAAEAWLAKARRGDKKKPTARKRTAGRPARKK